MESIEFEEGNSKRYMPYVNVFEATKSRVLTTNPDRLKTSGVAARFFVSPILAPDSSVAKVESLEIDKYNEDSSETSSVNKEKELEALEDEQKLANDSALYNNNEVSLQDHSRSAEKNKKNVKKMEEKKLECPIKLTCDKLKNNILKCEKDEKQLSNRSKKIGSPMKRQTQYLENVEVDCDPTRTTKKPDIVKMNSFSDLLALEEENKIEEVVEEVKKDTKRHESHHSNQISKENDAKFSSAVLKQNQNKTKKESKKNYSCNYLFEKVVFEKIIHIAYDNESKWDKVMQNEQITIHKIKVKF